MIQLRNNQLDLIKFIREGSHLGALAWHGMGLGKTLSSLTYCRIKLAELKALGVVNPKFLVILPKSAISHLAERVPRTYSRFIPRYVIDALFSA